MDQKKKGTVKFYNEDRGFGFITCEGKDYFVHVSALVGCRKLEADADVELELVDNKKRPGEKMAGSVRTL